MTRSELHLRLGESAASGAGRTSEPSLETAPSDRFVGRATHPMALPGARTRRCSPRKATTSAGGSPGSSSVVSSRPIPGGRRKISRGDSDGLTSTRARRLAKIRTRTVAPGHSAASTSLRRAAWDETATNPLTPQGPVQLEPSVGRSAPRPHLRGSGSTPANVAARPQSAGSSPAQAQHLAPARPGAPGLTLPGVQGDAEAVGDQQLGAERAGGAAVQPPGQMA